MMKTLTSHALSLSFVCFLCATASAHGGTWRGPGSRSPGDPTPSGPPSPSTWSSTWKLNREQILDLRRLQEERLKNRTPDSAPRFLGEAGEGNAPDGAEKRAWDEIVDALMIAARNKHPDVATGAVVALGKAADPRALPLLMELTEDGKAHHTVNESAALAIGMIGEGGPETRRFLEDVVTDPKQRTRTRAMAAVGLGFLRQPGSIPKLMAEVRAKTSSRDVPICAIVAIGLIGDEMVLPDLAQSLSGPFALREKDDFLRAYLGAALGLIGSRDAIPPLVRALGDEEVEVRRQAALSLAALASVEDTEVIDALSRSMATDRDHGVQAFCAVALGELGAESAADALHKAYHKGSPTLVPYATMALGLLARNGRDPELRGKMLVFLRREFAASGNLNVRGALAAALGIAGDRESIPALLKILGSKSEPGLRSHAAIALGLIGAEEAVPALRAALREKTSPILQHEAALALGLLGDRGATAILLDLVKTGSSEYVKGSAAVALGRLADVKTAIVLKEILEDERNPKMTRAFAAVALGKAVDRRPYPVLTRVGTHLNHSMAVEAILEILSIL